MSIHEVFAHLCVKDAPRALAFYAQAFGAVEKLRLTEPGGRIGHAELDFGGTTIMLADEFPEMEVVAPDATQGSSVSIHLHQFYGHRWLIGHHIEDVAADEMQRRYDAAPTVLRSTAARHP